MRNVRDTVHGFQERPHYEASELDTMFERAVSAFLKKKYGVVDFPIATDDLSTLIEQEVSDLDQYADLTAYGAGVEGMTEFLRGKKPAVRISEAVHRHENRLRTTLTHEYGHVILHAYLFAMAERQLKLGSKSEAQCDLLLSRQHAAVRPSRLDGMAGRLCLRRCIDAKKLCHQVRGRDS